MEDNIQNCCRICLDIESKHVSILDDPINLQVKSCLPITVALNDNLPKSICESCVSQLNEFYNFQLNARCSQDWLESSIQKKLKNSSDIRAIVQPLPDSEYNSDSLLEFLNNTENIEDYLNNLGKDDLPCIVNMINKTESCHTKTKASPKGQDKSSSEPISMDIDVLDSDIAIVKELLLKEIEPKQSKNEKLSCHGCRTKFDDMKSLYHHSDICDIAVRTCKYCGKLFNSRKQLKNHLPSHTDTEVGHVRTAYVCKECGDMFSNHLQLYRHITQHMKKLDEKICDVCGHLFVGYEALSRHREEDHEIPDKVLYRCKVCSYTSADRKEIHLHVSRHTQVRESRRHLCESCGQCFATQATLLRHSQQHGTKFHKCNVCCKKFTDINVRDKHMLEHIDMIMCEKCGKSITNINLEKHVCK